MEAAAEQHLTLKHHNIINGIVPVEIVNIDDFLQLDDYMIDYKFEVKYKFIFKDGNNPQNYDHDAWGSTTFNIFFITDSNKFYFKVPSFLLSYTLQYELSLSIIKYKKDENDEIIVNDINIISTIHSTTHSVEIPSILIELTHKINETVQYAPENSGYVRTGTILELLENNKIKIKTNTGYEELDNKPEIVIVHSSKVLRDCIYGAFIIDITNNINAIKDLILRTNDEGIMDIYGVLKEYLFEFYFTEMHEVEDTNWNFKFIGSLISTYICQFLCKYEHNYRAVCIFEDGNRLYVEQVWKYDILKTWHEIRNGKDTLELQNFSGTGYTCDICRCEASRYQFMYHCGADDPHDYCISCIYSLILQHNMMKQFINDCLDDLLNDDCIDQIVTFCVGKVSKFCV